MTHVGKQPEHAGASYLDVDTSGKVLAYVGPKAMDLFRAITVEHGLRMYHKHGMKPNSQWTPTRMLQAAQSLTGTQYRVGAVGYQAAITDLDAWIEKTHDALPKNVRR